MRSAWKVLGLLVILGVLSPAGAQDAPTQTGVIIGRVTDRTTGAPIAEATINVVGSVQGARTSDQGRYRITGVRPGTYSIRATRLGYAAESRSVTVAVGQEVTGDFTMGQTAVQIDEVVITATGETQRKRESGNVVATVALTPDRLAATTTLSQLLTAKAPGVYVNNSGGTTGSASRIRIRGANSVSLSNEPLLLIDGVRVNNEIGGTGTIGVGGQQSSRLNDINSDDIESLEIIKGPAAAALYGTAAANGVIQIRTKRGRAGRTQWTTYAEAGSQEDVITYPGNYAQVGTTTAGARTVGCTLDAQTRFACTPNPDSLVSFNPLEQASPFMKGYRTSLGLSASGGSDVAMYFISGDLDRDQGVFEPNNFRRVNLRANLTSQLKPSLTAQMHSSYASSRLEFPQNDNNILGVVSSGLLGSAFDGPSRGYLAGQTPQEIFEIDTRENVERFIGSAMLNWQALSWLSATGQAGVDFLDRRNKDLTRPNLVFFNANTVEGSRNSNAAQLWNYTTNGSLTATKNINENLRSTTTGGLQFTREVVQGTRAFGAKLLAGTGSVQGASARFAVGETNTDNRTLGALLSEQLAWRDRLFATLSVRTDNNSAFGSNFGWVTYPAASLSYVISEEGFFPRNDVLSSLRLRTAVGSSGQRPSFRDAITFFNTQTITTTAGDIPGIQVGGTGNADLKPEKSREFEVGFELGMFNDRVSVDFTAYDKRTKDLLIARPLPPSLGLSTSQFDNLGESSNQGLELQLTGRVFERENVRFDFDVTAASNRNRLEKIGTLPNGDPIPPIVFGIQRHAEGFPLGGYWDEKYTFEDRNNDGIISRLNCPGQAQLPGGPECEILIETLQYIGNPLPTHEFTFNPRITLFKYVEVGTLIDRRGGFKQFNNTARFRCNFVNCQEAYDASRSLEHQARNIAHLMATDAGYVEDSDYTKLREVSVSFTAPKDWANRIRAGDMRLTVAGRNLKTWTNYTGFDPEVNSTPTAAFSTSDFLTQPPLRVFSARLTMSF
jgi:TonB-dependent starch-binding outer membrane protein SusC